MDEYKYSLAQEEDEPTIIKLLSQADLPFSDIRTHLNNFILAKQNGIPIGVVGLEIYRGDGLLRSLTVDPAFRGRGIGKVLCQKMTAFARLKGINQLFLLTETAQEFFKYLGFVSIDRSAAPEAIRNTEEFNSLCPVSAVCMVKQIDHNLLYYPGEFLHLQEDVPGSKMWAVALEKTMLTYFEVEPDCCFDSHSHESEQITMVLEGELYFETGGNVTKVKSGEVIAVPSLVPHAVFTKEKAAKAVDAWSPVMPQYRR